MNEKLQHYLSLQYPIEIIPDEGGFLALIPDLPGCMSSGSTITEAVEGLNEAKELWLEGRLEADQPVPGPSTVEDYSGKFVLRIPRALHRSLDYEAKHQGVSLNHYVVHILSERHHLAALQKMYEVVVKNLARAADKVVQHLEWSWAECRRPTPKQVFFTEQGDPLEMLHVIPSPPKTHRFDKHLASRKSEVFH